MDAGLKLTQATLGAQVLSACVPCIGELFYRSCVASSLGQVTRGGVPVLFPQFAERGALPKHGFARHCYWSSDSEIETSMEVNSVKSLTIHDGDFPSWPHSAKLVLETDLTANSFRQTLTVTNIGADRFSWTGGLHPYFLLDDLESASLTGLHGVPYKDRYNEALDLVGQNQWLWNGMPCENLFGTAPAIRLYSASKELKISTTGFDQWMIWNPGTEGAKGLADMIADDWRRFVCVEPVCIDRPVVLSPAESFVGTLSVGWKAL